MHVSILILFAVLAWSRDPNTQIYSNQQAIEKATDKLAFDSRYLKLSCSNDKTYKYMAIGSVDAPFSAIITCNLHAREIITAQVCLQWMKSFQSSRLLKYFYIRVIYIGNHLREKAFQNSQFCIRKDENSIDLNRNFPTDFNAMRVPQSDEIYPGKMPISQITTICIQNLIESRLPDLYLDFHSGQFDMYYQQGVNNAVELELLEDVNTRFFSNAMAINTLAGVGETVNGNIFADLKVRKQVNYSFLFEVYKNPHQTQQDCFSMFNVRSKKHLNQITHKFSHVITYVLKAIKSRQ